MNDSISELSEEEVLEKAEGIQRKRELTAEDVRNHYLKDGVKELLHEATGLDGYKQAMITGFTGWYRYRGDGDQTEVALKPFKEGTYKKQIRDRMDEETRSLYWSTNFFEPEVFEQWVNKQAKDEGKVDKPGGYGTTGYYRLGIDIDLLDKEKLDELDHDRSVNKVENREMLEKAGQFVCDWFADHGLPYDALRPYFSGNGFYLTIDPSIAKVGEEAGKVFKVCEGFNALISELEQEFFSEVPEAKKYVQFDPLNNASRAWKTILSIHKSKPYVCVPLDPVGIEIDLAKAKPPVSEDVIKEAEEWIEPVKPSRRDKYIEKLGNILTSELIDSELFEDLLEKWGEEPSEKVSPMDVAEAKRKKKAGYDSKSSYESLELEIEDLESLKEVLPPCLNRLIEEKTALSHARGKGLLANTLKTVGLNREKALEIYNKLTSEAGGPTTNIFDSWFDPDMSLPSCDKINTVGSGYPSLEVGDLDLCEPDEICEKIDNPFEYIQRVTKPEGIKVVEKAMEELDYDSDKLGRVWDNEEQEAYYFSAYSTLGNVSSTREALNKLRRERIGGLEPKKNNIDQAERKRVIAQAVKIDLQRNGKLLKGEGGGRFYYYGPEKKVYRFGEIVPLLQRLYDISGSNRVGKTTKKRLKNAIENEGEEVKVRKTWYYDTGEEKLYVFDKDRHYFVLNGSEIHKEPNGTNGIYFLFDTPEDPVEYLPEGERETDFKVPGKISDNFKGGDCEVNELLANQTNFIGTTNLTAEQQRLQLLLHIYAFPFGELIPAKPIMLFTGEKGSTKSFTLKKLGRFFMRPDFRCRPLPGEDDFYVAVTKKPLTFFDNVESKSDWLEDALARVATEVRIAKRMLYEDFKEAKRDPKTFLGLTAREVSFNRDDVMDRSLLFHVGRLEEYIGEKKLEKPLREHKATLWSQYLDNLNKIVAKLRKDGVEDLESQHRLADWACLAIRIAEALGYDKDYDIDHIFEKMETERSAYTLRDSVIYQTIKQAKAAGTLTHDKWVPANKVEDQLRNADQYFNKKAKSIGRELNEHEKEYNEIFGVKIKQQRNRKVYYFPSPEDEGPKGPDKGKCEECGMAPGTEREVERGGTRVLCDACYEEMGYNSEVEQLG